MRMGEETIGDLYALLRVASIARECALEVVIISIRNYQEFQSENHTVINLHDASPQVGDILTFVCGPIIKGSDDFRELIRRFEHCRKLAIGVSILPKISSDHWNPFDAVLPRDGGINNYGDFAFTPMHKESGKMGNYLGLCLRGEQLEYGNGECLYKTVDELANRIMAQSGFEVKYLDTRILEDYNVAQIIKDFRDCKFIISSRMHGLLLSICLNIPCFAIDQIKGGAKVGAEAKRIGWPLVANINQDGINEFLTNSIQNGVKESTLARCREKISDDIHELEERIKTLFKESF